MHAPRRDARLASDAARWRVPLHRRGRGSHGDPAAVQEKLSAGKSGDYHVLLAVKPLEAGKQQVRLAFHESKRTYVYEYAVTGTRIVPLSSEYRDLARSAVVRYSGE